jgi:hypothetical protein
MDLILILRRRRNVNTKDKAPQGKLETSTHLFGIRHKGHSTGWIRRHLVGADCSEVELGCELVEPLQELAESSLSCSQLASTDVVGSVECHDRVDNDELDTATLPDASNPTRSSCEWVHVRIGTRQQRNNIHNRKNTNANVDGMAAGRSGAGNDLFDEQPGHRIEKFFLVFRVERTDKEDVLECRFLVDVESSADWRQSVRSKCSCKSSARTRKSCE